MRSKVVFMFENILISYKNFGFGARGRGYEGLFERLLLGHLPSGVVVERLLRCHLPLGIVVERLLAGSGLIHAFNEEARRADL